MVTRFWFPLDTASEVNPAFGAWGENDGALRRKLVNVKGTSAITIGTRHGWTAGQTQLDRQYVSAPMAAGISFSSVTVKLYLMTREYAFADNSTSRLLVKIVNKAGVIIQQTLLALGQFGPAKEYVNNVSHRNKSFADGDAVSGTYTTVQGDRLVVEIGHTDAAGTTPEASCKFGEDAADAAENETGTTNAAGWIEFSNNIKFEVTKTFTVDAIIVNRFDKTFTVDALLEKTQTKSFTIDAILKATLSKSFSIDALLKKTLSKTFTADAILKFVQTKLFSIDAILKATIPKSYTIDAILKATQAKNFSIDALLKITLTKQFSIDGILKATLSKNFLVDAILKIQKTKIFIIDSLLKATFSKTFTLDASIKAIFTKTYIVDAFLKQIFLKTFTIDAILVAGGSPTKTFLIDGILKNTFVKQVSIDAILVTPSLEGGIRGRVRVLVPPSLAPFVETPSINPFIKKHQLDFLIQQEISLNFKLEFEIESIFIHKFIFDLSNVKEIPSLTRSFNITSNLLLQIEEKFNLQFKAIFKIERLEIISSPLIFYIQDQPDLIEEILNEEDLYYAPRKAKLVTLGAAIAPFDFLGEQIKSVIFRLEDDHEIDDECDLYADNRYDIDDPDKPDLPIHPNCKCYWEDGETSEDLGQSLATLGAAEDELGRWITTDEGIHVFIKEGESLEQAFTRKTQTRILRQKQISKLNLNQERIKNIKEVYLENPTLHDSGSSFETPTVNEYNLEKHMQEGDIDKFQIALEKGDYETSDKIFMDALEKEPKQMSLFKERTEEIEAFNLALNEKTSQSEEIHRFTDTGELDSYLEKDAEFGASHYESGKDSEHKSFTLEKQNKFFAESHPTIVSVPTTEIKGNYQSVEYTPFPRSQTTSSDGLMLSQKNQIYASETEIRVKANTKVPVGKLKVEFTDFMSQKTADNLKEKYSSLGQLSFRNISRDYIDK